MLVVEEKRGFIEDQLRPHSLQRRRLEASLGGRQARRERRAAAAERRRADADHGCGRASSRGCAGSASRARRSSSGWRGSKRSTGRSSASAPTKLQRTPFFCSGCPHNTSTKVPEGSRAMAGIGCHGMALYVPSRRTATITHMGGEGATWIGQAPFTSEAHIFQNLGDGTYTHSGLLAIRAAAAAGVNITYKILYNDAVAMTGGQPAEGGLTVAQIAHQVCGRRRQAPRHRLRRARRNIRAKLLPGRRHGPSSPRARRRAARTARDQGLTVLIYDQTCAAEKRRRRKRGLYPDPPKRVVHQSSASAKAAATARRTPIASRCSRSKPNSAASARSTSRTATRTFPASTASARASSPCMAASCGRPIAPRPIRRRLFADLPAAATPALDGALQHPRHRHRRHRRHHHRRAARHGGASRRQGLLDARLHRPGAEERRGHEPCPDRARAGRSRHRPHRRPAAPISCSAATSWSPPASRR